MALQSRNPSKPNKTLSLPSFTPHQKGRMKKMSRSLLHDKRLASEVVAQSCLPQGGNMERKLEIKIDYERGEAMILFPGLRHRALITTPETFVDMMKTSTAILKTAGLSMFHMMGEEKGRHDVRKELETLKEQGVILTGRQILEAIIDHSRAAGWGACQIRKYEENKGAVVIRVENNPLAIALGKTDEPMCHYLRAYWTGLVSEALEREVECTETRCMSKGDPHYEFVIVKQASK